MLHINFDAVNTYGTIKKKYIYLDWANEISSNNNSKILYSQMQVTLIITLLTKLIETPISLFIMWTNQQMMCKICLAYEKID